MKRRPRCKPGAHGPLVVCDRMGLETDGRGFPHPHALRELAQKKARGLRPEARGRKGGSGSGPHASGLDPQASRPLISAMHCRYCGTLATKTVQNTVLLPVMVWEMSGSVPLVPHCPRCQDGGKTAKKGRKE